jgi:type I restriction enzyme S subunit
VKLPAYPRTKPSGVEWLGDVPEHWEVKRIRHLGSIRYGLGEPPEYVDDGLPFVRATDIKRGKINLDEVKKVRSEDVPWSRKPLLNLEEILVVRSGAYTGDSAIVSSNVAGCIAGYDMVLSVKRGEPAFVAWALLSKYLLQGQIYLERMRAAQPHLNAEELGGFLILTPPLPEQRAIAAFLDRETGRVDLLVAKKRELIERLNEKRTALISRTVTRGLPPAAARAAGLPADPPLKPSGIDWLGDIPEHWEVVPLFRIVETIQTGPFGSQLHSADYVEGGIPLINPAHIIASRLVPDEMSAVDECTAVRLSRHRLREGDIIMARRGEIGRCGVVGRQEASWLCGTGSLVVRLRDCNPTYFATIISGAGFRGLLELHAVGTTMLNLNPTIVGRMLVPVPPHPQQAAIAAYLDLETAKLDALVGKVEEAVERLQEYRTALITAAVTGKIDVRKEVAP